MIVARTANSVKHHASAWRRAGNTVSLVPTMGALHDGHRSLIRRAKRAGDRCVVSIFVNPTQFGPREDFQAYPRTWASDRAICLGDGVDLIFAPAARAMYPLGFTTTISVGEIGAMWEGESRPGHFDGVATVVAKLFNIVEPDLAVFGQKDFQQSVVIRRVVADLNLNLGIIVAPTVREPGGLALSSRNVYLDERSRLDAQAIYRALRWGRDEIRKGRTQVARLKRAMTKQVEQTGTFAIDYLGFCDPLTLQSKAIAKPPIVILMAAICLSKGPAQRRRLIDNLLIR